MILILCRLHCGIKKVGLHKFFSFKATNTFVISEYKQHKPLLALATICHQPKRMKQENICDAFVFVHVVLSQEKIRLAMHNCQINMPAWIKGTDRRHMILKNQTI